MNRNRVGSTILLSSLPLVFLCASSTGSFARGKAGDDKKTPGLSLDASRKLDFTTDEGTWISLDVSPDGKTILFELVGQFYTIPIEGGEAKRITDGGLAFNSQPVYSPDGSHIAFVSDRSGADNLWICNIDGSDPKKLTDDKTSSFISPSWTPDGESLLVSKVGTGWGAAHALFLYDIKGGSGIEIKSPKGGPNDESGGIASRDGRYFYFAAGLKHDLPNQGMTVQIFRRDRATGEREQVTSDLGDAFRPVLSPNGKLLVYATHHDAKTGLRVLNLETGEDRSLKYPVQHDAREGGSERDLLPAYAFTPDGSDIIVSYDGKIHRVNVTTGQERLIPFTAHVSQGMGPKLDFPERVEDGPSIKARLIENPVESPDGKHLAFSCLTHLYVMDLPNGTPRRVTQGDAREYHPAWSPDGAWLAFVTWTPQEGGQLWKVHSDGQGQAQQLTQFPAYYTFPVWTPDGSKIVALRSSMKEARESHQKSLYARLKLADLIWIAPDGGTVHRITAANGAMHPYLTNDPDRIFLPVDAELQSVRWDGSDRRTVLKIDMGEDLDFAFVGREILLNPQGNMALVQFRTQLYLIDVPQAGGEAPVIKMNASSVAVKKLTDIGADYANWAGNGSMITWALGAKYFRQPLSSISFESKKTEGQQEVRTQEKPPVEVTTVSIEKPRYTSKGVVVLRGAQVITMKGDEIIQNADVVVTDNRITSVGRRGSASVPANAKIIDVSGATIVPGFVDTHDHWLDIGHFGVLDMDNWNFLANLAFGVTTGRDPQTFTNDLFAYQDLVEMGEMIGPRAFSTGPGIFDTSDLKSAEDAYNVVSKYQEYYRTHTIKSYMVGNRQQRQWMVEACQKLHIMPTTEGGADLKMDMTHAIDGFAGNEHALPIFPLFKDVAQLYTQSNIAYTPTFVVDYGGPTSEDYFFEHFDIHDDPKVKRFVPHTVLDGKVLRRSWARDSEYVFPQIAESAAKIIRAGGRVCIGAHGELHGIAYDWEMWSLAAGGISNLEVLRSATLRGAEAIGYAQDLGSIEPGKLADLLVLTKDPLKDIHNTTSIKYVMKNGQIFEGDTLNEVWPNAKPLPSLWFWNDKP